MKSIAGKSVLITGAAAGIGRALALELARQGANLFLVDLDQERLAEVADLARAKHHHVAAHVADLTRPDDLQGIVDRLLKRSNGVDILINNAGIGFYGSTHRMTDEQWDTLMAVNLLAPIELTRKLLPTMLRRSEAHVLNVCSIAGLVAAPKMAAYHASKFALVGFSESLRAEYGPRGLGVTSLCPGFVRTNILQAPMTAPGQSVPRLPAWITTSPERVARRAIRAIHRSEGVVVVTPLAHFVWRFKRYAPGLLDWLHQFRVGRRRGDSILPPPKRKPFADKPPVVAMAEDDSPDEVADVIPFSIPLRQRRRAA